MIAPGKVIVLYKIITYKTERRKTLLIVTNVLTLVEECQKKVFYRMKNQLLIFFNGLIMKVIMEEMSLHGDFDTEGRTEENEDNTTDSQANEDEVDVHPPRKLLTKKRLVHDIDSAFKK